MDFVYILLMIFTVSYPLAKSFEDKIYFFGKWKYVFKATIPFALIFIVWDNWFTQQNIWFFNNSYILDVNIFYLPIEECLFFIFIPFSCLFIYEVMNFYVKKNILEKYVKSITILLIVLSIYFIVIYKDRLYPLILFSILIPVLLFYLIKKPSFLGRFYLSFLVCIFPFLIVNGLLTSLPVIYYNSKEIIGLYIYTIPIEDLFYGMLYLLLISGLYAYFKDKEK